MTTRFSIIITTFFILFCVSAHAQQEGKKNPLNVPVQVSKEKKSLLKKLSDALKFTKNTHEKERIRTISLIDTLLKDSLLLSGKDFNQSQKILKDSLWQRLKELQASIDKIKSAQENQKPLPKPSSAENQPAEGKQKVNNDRYIESLIDAILEKDKTPDPVALHTKQQKLSIIKKLLIKPNQFKDTIAYKNRDGKILHLTERLRTIKLKHAAEVWGFLPYNTSENEFNYRLFSAAVINAYALNGNTGRSLNEINFTNSELTRRAKLMNCKLIMGVTASDLTTSTFLKSNFAPEQFNSKIAQVLAENKMDGINIQFTGIDNVLSPYLISFITALSKECRKNGRNILLSLTIPAFDINKGYPIAILSPLVDRFLIDFTQQLPEMGEPLAPLKQQSDYSIETCVSRYLNIANVSTSKFIILLPLYGIKWDIDTKGKAKNAELLSYSKIRSNYQFIPVTYDQQTANALIELADTAGTVHTKIWFDDENTLDKKFDFALEDNLGGVAIWDMTADIGYGEISDAIAYKFLVADTITSDSLDITYKNQKFGWDYIIRNLKTYYFVLGNPCHDTHDIVDRTLLSYINILLIIICLALCYYCYFKFKYDGYEWEYRKPMLIITGIMTFIFITTGFAWIYLDADIPWFGVDNNCIDMPFFVLYLIILVGIALGILLMRLILFPIVREEDMP